MTNDNYTNLSNDELLGIVKSYGIDCGHLYKYLNNHNSNLLHEIIQRTKFLSFDISINARLYCIEYGLNSHPTCQCNGCDNKVEWNKRTKTFLRYCSKNCAYDDEHHWDRIKSTCIEKWGVDNPGKSEVIQGKM